MLNRGEETRGGPEDVRVREMWSHPPSRAAEHRRGAGESIAPVTSSRHPLNLPFPSSRTNESTSTPRHIGSKDHNKYFTYWLPLFNEIPIKCGDQALMRLKKLV